MDEGLIISDLAACIGTFEISSPHLHVAKGQMAALMGPSGSGKSSFLLALAGFLPLRKGTITYDGKSLEILPPEKRKMAMAFQSPALFPHLDVFGNVGFGLRLRGEPKHRIQERVEHWLEVFEISELKSRWPFQLSGGQAQRVALARTLAVNFPILLLDEPFSNLEEKLRDAILGKILQHVEEQHCVCLWVTHDSQDAQRYAKSIYHAASGRIEERLKR